MTIKIKAPQTVGHDGKLVRIVRESDWRKLMKLVKVVEDFNGNPDVLWDDVEAALDALKEKKK